MFQHHLPKRLKQDFNGLFVAEDGTYSIVQWFSKRGPQSSSMDITWELVRSTKFQVPLSTYWIRSLGVRPNNLSLNKSPRGFWCKIKFESHGKSNQLMKHLYLMSISCMDHLPFPLTLGQATKSYRSFLINISCIHLPPPLPILSLTILVQFLITSHYKSLLIPHSTSYIVLSRLTQDS